MFFLQSDVGLVEHTVQVCGSNLQCGSHTVFYPDCSWKQRKIVTLFSCCVSFSKYTHYGETLVVFDKHLSGETAGVIQHHLSVFAQTLYPSSLRSWLARIFTGPVLVIVFSFSSCPSVTTAFFHAVWAKPCCDSDFPNSVCVTVPGSPVPLQKQTGFSSPMPLMGPLFSSSCSTGSDLYKFLFGESFLFLALSCNGNMETSRVLHFRLRTQVLMDVMFPLEVFVYDSHYPF